MTDDHHREDDSSAWVPIDVYPPNAVDQVLLACGHDADVRVMRERLSVTLRAEGLSARDIDRTLDRAEVLFRAAARRGAEASLAAARARLTADAESVER